MLSSSRCKAALAIAAVGFLCMCTPSTAISAERMVLAENFTATWCGYCPEVSTQLVTMMNTHPEFILIQWHSSDGYEIGLGGQRSGFYGVSGIPAVSISGGNKVVGSGQPMSLWETQFNNAHNLPTDVLIEVGAELVSGSTYRVSARVCREDDASGTLYMNIYMVVVRDWWPSGANYYRACAVAGAHQGWESLIPGECAEYEDDFNLSAHMSYASDLKIVVFAQQYGSTAPKTVYQVAEMDWPFSPLPPDTLPGDLDGDGDIDFDDIDPFVMALSGQEAYEAAYPDGTWLNADCDLDGDVDFDDIDAFVALLGG